MDNDPKRKPVKIGVKAGGGPEPGYCWNVLILDRAFEEAMDLLDADQYAHLSQQVKELARQENPRTSETVDVRPIEDYFEIRDKGGILNRLNIRIFFFVREETQSIVILGTVNKQNNGHTPVAIRVTMRRRKRLYLEAYPDGAE
jgi:hypothetical protein